jgi:hypothetical protein
MNTVGLHGVALVVADNLAEVSFHLSGFLEHF